MQHSDEDDEALLAALVIPGGTPPPSTASTHQGRKAPRRRATAGFVRMPLVWKERLAGAKHAATLKLALEVLFETWRLGDSTITLSSAVAARAGVVSRKAKQRALAELERLGLITVTRQGHQAPRVSVTDRPHLA